MLAAGGEVTAEAEAEFAKAGDDPRARFYGAEAALQRGDREAAKASAARTPGHSAGRGAMAQGSCKNAWPRLPQGGETFRVSSRPLRRGPGRRRQDVAAAQSMSPEERQAMICSTVDWLAARREQNPNDNDGWTRLAHAYDVLRIGKSPSGTRAGGTSSRGREVVPAATRQQNLVTPSLTRCVVLWR